MVKDYVTASELGEYIYCQCCWLDTLEGKKVTTLQMEEGSYFHEKTNSQYFLVRILKRIVLTLIILSVAIGLISGILLYLSQ